MGDTNKRLSYTDTLYVGFFDHSHQNPLVSRGTRWCLKAVSFVSSLRHALIGDGQVWYNRGFGGSGYLSWELLADHPVLAAVVIIPSCPVSVQQESIYAKVRVVPTILRFLTAGLFPSNDCVSHTTKMLQNGGVYIPWWVVTPDQLFQWLRSKGYTIVQPRPKDSDDLGRPPA